MSVVTAKLKGEAAKWMITLHNEDTPELRDAGRFLGELQARFEDEAKTQQVEGEIRELKQRGWPVNQYI